MFTSGVKIILTLGVCFFPPSAIFKSLLCHLLALGRKSWTAQSCTKSRNDIKWIISKQNQGVLTSQISWPRELLELWFFCHLTSVLDLYHLLLFLWASWSVKWVTEGGIGSFIQAWMSCLGKKQKGYWKFKRASLKIVFVTQENFL